MREQKETADKNIFYTMIKWIILPLNAVQIGFNLLILKILDIFGSKPSIADLRKTMSKSCEEVIDMFETEEEKEEFRAIEKQVVKMIESEELKSGYDVVMTVKKMSGLKYF